MLCTIISFMKVTEMSAYIRYLKVSVKYQCSDHNDNHD